MSDVKVSRSNLFVVVFMVAINDLKNAIIKNKSKNIMRTFYSYVRSGKRMCFIGVMSSSHELHRFSEAWRSVVVSHYFS